MTTKDNEIKQISSTQYSCEKCNFNTVRKNNYETHLLTAKHAKTTNNNEIKQTLSTTYSCDNCNKSHNDRAGLWRHKKKCVPQTSGSIDKDELIMTLVKQNAELIKETTEVKTMMVEVIKNGTHITNNTNNNNTFNLNFFLNETCKDAMNLEDFIKSIKWQISDLEMVHGLGFAKGVSKLIIDKLNLLGEDKRPIHCTDVKREVMYVRDSDKWEKEQEGNPTMRHAVKKISHHNLVVPVLQEYRTLNPPNKVSESDSTKYSEIITAVICGVDAENEDIIIRNISKEVAIKKK